MYAVFVVTEIDASRGTEAETFLKSKVAPKIKQAPGFVRGTWARSAEGREGRSMVLFETEEAARTAVEAIRSGMAPDGPVKIKTTSVLEVVHEV